jgi:hypothetical protein
VLIAAGGNGLGILVALGLPRQGSFRAESRLRGADPANTGMSRRE